MKANRIQELINLSGIDVREYYDENGSTLAELQKFAELIVRECGEWCGHDAQGVAAMFKHFGVTE